MDYRKVMQPRQTQSFMQNASPIRMEYGRYNKKAQRTGSTFEVYCRFCSCLHCAQTLIILPDNPDNVISADLRVWHDLVHDGFRSFFVSVGTAYWMFFSCCSS